MYRFNFRKPLLSRWLWLMGTFSLLCGFSACNREPQYSIIPEITKFLGSDYIANGTDIPYFKISFRFQDGDGDVGLNTHDNYYPFDSTSTYYYNFFVNYYEKQHGVYTRIDSVTPPLGERIAYNSNARIPRMSENVPEPIEVDLTIDLSFNPFSLFDTIYYEFYIVDRALHQSNTFRTPDLILKR